MTNNQIPTVTKKKTKGRTFQCTGYPDCNMTFTRSEHLARHIRKHTGERPFECIHCSRKFSRLDNLRQHKQTVHAHETNNNNNNNGNGNGNEGTSEIKQIDDQLNEENNKDFLQQQNSNLPAAATSLLRPTQFRSKHRPRPIALPSRKTVYNDAPYTVPTPRSASSTSNQLLLSPISPANSIHQLQYPKSTTSSQFHGHHLHPNNNGSTTSYGSSYSHQQQYLPSVQFLTSNGQHSDSLISPYNSSFSSNLSNANTPTNSSFDSTSRTPTNPSFGGFNKAPLQHYSHYYDGNNSNNNNQNHINSHVYEHEPQQQQQQPQQQPQHQQQPHRRSWLNNVLNNEQQSHQYQTSPPPPQQQQQQQYQYNNHANYQSSSSSSTSSASSASSKHQQHLQSLQNLHHHHQQQQQQNHHPHQVPMNTDVSSTNNRVRIENLLNSSTSNPNPSTTLSSISTNSTQSSQGSTSANNENDRIKLPHVSNLGINITKN